MEKQTLNRIGAICAGLGVIATGVFYGIHPDLADPAGYLPLVAGSSHFAGIHWGLVIGVASFVYSGSWARRCDYFAAK